MLKVAIGDFVDGDGLYTNSPYNGERILATSSYHETNGVFKAVTRTTQGTTIITEPVLGAAVVITGILVTARKSNLAVITMQLTDDVQTETLFSAELANEAFNVPITIPYGWRGWVNARLELVLSVADATVNVTTTYTKIPTGEDYTTWDAKR